MRQVNGWGFKRISDGQDQNACTFNNLSVAFHWPFVSSIHLHNAQNALVPSFKTTTNCFYVVFHRSAPR
jgi:hypothetical protein